MDLKCLGENWEQLGKTDPMWAILMLPECKEGRWDPHAFFHTGDEDIRMIMAMVRELRFPLRRGRALDFGCGLGRMVQPLARYFDEVCGVDISPAMIEGARRHNPYGDRCRFYVNRRDDLELFADDEFDFVNSLMVLQHVRPDYVCKYIAELVRVLAPGGVLMFQEPSHYITRPLPSVGYLPWSYRIPKKLRKTFWQIADRLAPARTGADRLDEITRPKVPWLAPLMSTDRGPHRARSAEAAAEPPLVEIHAIRHETVLALLESLRCRVLHCQPRNDTSCNWPSFRYYVTK